MPNIPIVQYTNKPDQTLSYLSDIPLCKPKIKLGSLLQLILAYANPSNQDWKVELCENFLRLNSFIGLSPAPRPSEFFSREGEWRHSLITHPGAIKSLIRQKAQLSSNLC